MSYGPGYACASCKTMLRPRKNEIYVGVLSDDKPYQVWCADLWECPGCETQTILGYGQEPIAEHYEEKFDYWRERITHTVDGKLKALP